MPLSLFVLLHGLPLACGDEPAPVAPPAPAPPVPVASPSAAPPPSPALGFAALAEDHVMGSSCAYEFAPGQGPTGAAFQHDGDESWIALAGVGDLRITPDDGGGAFGGERESFTLPDGQGALTVDHTASRMVLTGAAAGPSGTLEATLVGGCGD
ncbi:MAG: hypothetical protein H6742_20460 [Alphaproteobacteria bacterium]|nr:hypothetical protein [Alphaproteobacteria bacterium]